MPPMAPTGGPLSGFLASFISSLGTWTNQRSVTAASTWICPGASWSNASRSSSVSGASPKRPKMCPPGRG